MSIHHQHQIRDCERPWGYSVEYSYILHFRSEGSQMLFYVWFEFTSWLRGVGQGKGAWDCFLTIWAWDSCAFCNGKIKELDYWEIQPLLGLLDHGKVPVIN